jgi:hypothetical protein
MKDKFLPWFLLFCALGLSGTAAYYSVVGLSVVFVGVALPVIIMGSFLEISKIAIATYLHDKWKETYGVLKIYMTIALVTLSLITSLGIYGLLSTGFQENIAKLEINEKQVKNVEVKKKRFEEIKVELTKEKSTLDGDITKLRDGLSNNTTTQSVDQRTGQVITRANNANRKTFELQLKEAQIRRDTIAKRIDNMNDSITKLDIEILNMESKEISGNELGTIKYISEMSGWSIKKTANIFILILIFVFDPLAITLVIATNQAFKSKRKEEETTTPQVTPQVTIQDTTHVTPQVTIQDTTHDTIQVTIQDTTHDTIQDTNQVPTNYQSSTEQVNIDIFKEIVQESIKDDIEIEKNIDTTELSNEIILDEINNIEDINRNESMQNKRLTYSNRNAGNLRINRF